MTLIEQIKAARLPAPAERRSIREAAGVTLTEIADELGVTATAVMRWERGTEPQRDRAIAYRQLLDALRDAVR